ncbi:hypothetical protein AX17_002066 [Amanita inopinata Kibby_2008]|nr:hypothetical protein AX17_002066 [Amanita inopinata Kibby_2008]
MGTTPSKGIPGVFAEGNDSPPPYSQSPGSSHKANKQDKHIATGGQSRGSTEEDLLYILKRFDTVFIVDDSSSMRGTRWDEARSALATLADVAGKYDDNGIDIYFLNNDRNGKNVKSSKATKKLFDSVSPSGATPIGYRLEGLLREYLSTIESLHNKPAELKKVKPINYLIITDGRPTDEPKGVIVQAAKRLDAKYFPLTQVGIQFVQIGNDPYAEEYLKGLDNNLAAKHEIRDMVDTAPYNGYLDAESLAKVLLGGINRRIDNENAKKA